MTTPAVSAPAADWNEELTHALNLQLAGRADLAERALRSILEAAPSYAPAHFRLGMLNVQVGRAAEAIPHLTEALNLRPERREYWLGYLEGLVLAGDVPGARTTLALAREHGLAGREVDDLAGRIGPEPAPPPKRAPRLQTLKKSSRTLQRLIDERQVEEAIDLATAMTARFPDDALSWKRLGALLWWKGRSEEALRPMQKAVRLLPRDAEAHSNCGMALWHAKREDEALAMFRRALTLDPLFAAAHYHLGMMQLAFGQYAEAEGSLAAAARLRPDYLTADERPMWSDLLFLYSHDPALSAETLFAEHRRFGSVFADLPPLHGRTPSIGEADKALRIGLVSGDFNDHAVASFIEPVLAALKQRLDVQAHAYYNGGSGDGVTSRLSMLFAAWHPVKTLSDDQLARLIAGHRIDILIDLSGHTALNRLRAFARKPAPVQASWMGYPGTTGLTAMDYLFADAFWLPPPHFDRCFTEKLVYLPASAAFQPHPTAPTVNPLPAAATGRFTFGSFNRPGKLNSATLSLWARLLQAVPTADLFIAGIPRPDQRQELARRLQSLGIDESRVILHGRESMDRYLALHHRVDLCLDTLPYCGGTTTHHALWMGVPTLTLAGSTPPARQGANILGLADLPDFIASSPEDFVARGIAWSGRLQELADLRAGLRDRCRRSTGHQPALIAAGLAAALRQMWNRWCAGLPPESFTAVPSPSEVP